MKLDVIGLGNKQPAAIVGLVEVCKACAKEIAPRVGAASFIDDIAQDMAMLVLERLLPRYDQERDIEPFLREVARRMGLAYYRKHSKELLPTPLAAGLDPFELVEAGDLRPDEHTEEDDADVRARRAKETLVQRMRDKAREQKQPRSKPKPPTSAAAERRQPRGRLPEQLERARHPLVRQLVEIRRSMGLTQPEMSVSLGQTWHKIAGIEGGVLQIDESLLKGLVAQAKGLQKKYRKLDAGMSGPELIRYWCKQLDLAEDDTIELSKLIGVHRSTIWRWSEGETQPPPHRVRQLNAVVEALRGDL